MTENCIFCKIVKEEIESEKVYGDDNFIGILDIDPKAEGHTLIIPKNHYATLLDMPNSLGNEFIEAIKKVALKLIDEKKAEGFNVLINNFEIGGQLVPHLHAHIIPRKKDDRIQIIG